MKRLVVFVLFITLLCGTIIGCGGQDSGIQNKETETQTGEIYETKTSLSEFNIVTDTADKVILDCDMSYVNDDAFALMYLLQADMLGYIDLLGVSVSGGNKIGAVATNVTLLQLEAVGRTDVPVYIGQDEPLQGFNVERANLTDWPGEVYSNMDKYVTPDNYHNLGELYSEAWGYSETKAQPESAAAFMVEQVKQYPGEVTILCIGPTTNVALACLQDENFAENTAGIIYMGGKLEEDSSFNWWYDADAVKVCLESAFPKQIICTSEISGNMQIPADFIDGLTEFEKSTVAQFFVKRKSLANSNKKLWDVVIPAVLMCPELVTVSEERFVEVSVEEATYGQMKFVDDGMPATVISEVNGQELYNLMGLLFCAEDRKVNVEPETVVEPETSVETETPVEAEPEIQRSKTVLFAGQVTKEFTGWDNWSEAIRFDKHEFDISAFNKPFTVTVDYESDSDPILVFFSWTGGPGWAQMNPSFTSDGTAYYTFDMISGYYGEDFSLLDAINVMPGGADLTVTEVAFFYEEDTEINIDYEGLAGEVVSNITVGWNLGNTLDSHGDWIEQYTAGTPADYETAWGNPVTTKAIIDDVKKAGFNAVRVPVTWDQHIDDEKGFQIDEQWMSRVQEVVDYVIENDMYCIINLHHDAGSGTWLHASDANIQKNEEKFKAVWKQIAERFEGYDSKLLFEGFNEMLDDNNNWNYPGEEGAEAINKWNQMFVDTVRATGGNNAERVLIVNTYAASSGSGNLEKFKLPEDSAENSLIVEVHCYSPWSYCSTISESENLQKVWTENSGKATIDGILSGIYYNFTCKGIPVIIGEFGATAKENEADRAAYAGYMVETAGKYGVRCFWWDDGGKMEINPEVGYFTGFALYDRRKMEWKYPQIVEAMTNAAKPGQW